MTKSGFSGIALLILTTLRVEGLEVDCDSEGARNIISCRCVGAQRSNDGFEDLSDITNGYIQDRFGNLAFRHVELRDCERVHISLNLRTFVIEGRYFNISDVSFTNIRDLELDIENIDYGYKRFVFEDIRRLKLSGRLESPTTIVRIFSRISNFETQSGDILFQDFLARSQIHLINIQDANSVRVVDSAFENLLEAEVRGTTRCHLGLTSLTVVDCNRPEQLFVSTVPYTSSATAVLTHPAFIAVLALIIIAVLVGIAALIYAKQWKKKKEIELLGFPPPSSTMSRTTPPASSARLSNLEAVDKTIKLDLSGGEESLRMSWDLQGQRIHLRLLGHRLADSAFLFESIALDEKWLEVKSAGLALERFRVTLALVALSRVWPEKRYGDIVGEDGVQLRLLSEAEVIGLSMP
eukprot:maker-scaffold12_size759060-snap-gene-4.14 protein:Tk05574 transcript:maker-scaffold12_size759060-snap-gene-4.14-mRNA-1 annotation:"polygalacturonase"